MGTARPLLALAGVTEGWDARVRPVPGTQPRTSAAVTGANPNAGSCLAGTCPKAQRCERERAQEQGDGEGGGGFFPPLFFPLAFWLSNDNGLVHYKQFPNCS